MTIIHNARHVMIPAMMGLRVFAPRGTAGAANWWVVDGVTCVAAYQPKGAADYAASKVNLANPGTYNATDGATTPSFATATGWRWDHYTDYLDTGFVPTNTMSAIVRYNSDATTTYNAVLGSMTNGASAGFIIMPNYGQKHGILWASTEKSAGSYSQTGVMALTPGGGYLNGSKTITLTGTWSGTSTSNIWIGCYNKYGTANVSYTHSHSYIYAAAFYATELSEAQVATLSTAMAAL